MPYPQIPRNCPIATLIEWYCDKKSGKVTDARKEIQKRFNYQDWEDQKRIVMAFLQSGKTDREWAYNKVYYQWDDSYLEQIRTLWELHHEYVCAWSVIEHFPIEYVKENAQILEEVNGYYHLCMRFSEDPSYAIDRSKLSDKEFLLVMLNAHRKVDEEEARDIFFRSIHDYCLNNSEYFTIVPHKSRRSAFSIEDIDHISSILWIFHLVELENLRKFIMDWNQKVMATMYNCAEFKILNEAIIDDEEYDRRRMAIGLKYLYLALDDKYKLPTDTSQIEKLLRLAKIEPSKEAWQKTQKHVSLPMTNEQREETAFLLEEMIAQNPAISKLIGTMNLGSENDYDDEELPF